MQNLLSTVEPAYLIAGAVFLFLALGFLGASLWLWTIYAAAVLWIFQAPTWLWIAFAVIAVVFNIPPIRRILVTSVVFKLMKVLNFIPKISETERVALEAGDVWIEGELFSGKPDLTKMMDQPYPDLTVEERAFMDGPVEKLCQIVNDWDVWQKRDLPEKAWDFIKKEKFWGMVIPKEYGGLGFSGLGHSAVLAKLGTRSIPTCITVMVPNSLGPGELLVHYGTKAQKDHYLPRLARGEEIPCFALTEPTAGSDAASISSNGTVFKGDDGKLYLRLNWNKRYITLAAVSTLMGIAFRLRDPENHLGQGEDVGITCALVPTNTPGVVVNRRHDPMGVPFFNSPTQGKDVVVPIDAIIGGTEWAGRGWKMLMESLAAGRGISLPAQATGGAKFLTRVVSAHAAMRKQFGMSIGRFEGIADPLAQIVGFTYLMEAARKYTAGAIDQGSKPPVITAMAKYNFTELSRIIINHAMDILGGAGISRGPRNLLANAYAATPISITVEGANILTRTLIIFGQGAMRAHPYAFKEVAAVEANDLKGFDAAFWAHLGLVFRNKIRSILLFVSRGYLASPYKGGVTRRYYQKLSWASATFAFMADLAMATLGGQLKAKGKITGRFADILSWMYLATATLRRFEAEGRRKEDEPLLHWSMQYSFAQIQKAFDGLFGSMRMPLIGLFFRGPLRWMWAANPIGRMPKDELDMKLSQAIQSDLEFRDRLTDDVFMPQDSNEALARLEKAFRLSLASDDVARKVRRARKKGILQKKPAAQLYKDALEKGVITQAEFNSLAEAEVAVSDAIQVDSFDLQEYIEYRSDEASPSRAGSGGIGASATSQHTA